MPPDVTSVSPVRLNAFFKLPLRSVKQRERRVRVLVLPDTGSMLEVISMPPLPRFAAALLLLAATTSLFAEPRTFVSNTGTTLRGELVEVKGDQVTIRRDDGQILTLVAGAFCPKDQAYFKEHSAPDLGGLSNSFLGIPFGTDQETALKEIALRTHAERDTQFNQTGRWKFNHGNYFGLETDSYYVAIVDGKLAKVVIYGFFETPDKAHRFEPVKRALAQHHGRPLAEVDSEDHVHQEWAYPIQDQTEPYHISIDFTPSNTKYMLIYEGPPVLGAQLQAPIHPGVSVFSGTKWKTNGANLELSSDGTWTEHWGKKTWTGVWKSTTPSQIVACREDGYIYHFDLASDGQSVRRSDSIVLKKD